jgi:hypothetical protein
MSCVNNGQLGVIGPSAIISPTSGSTPSNSYVAEDGVTGYVTEDGVTPYVTET